MVKEISFLAKVTGKDKKRINIPDDICDKFRYKEGGTVCRVKVEEIAA